MAPMKASSHLYKRLVVSIILILGVVANQHFHFTASMIPKLQALKWASNQPRPFAGLI